MTAEQRIESIKDDKVAENQKAQQTKGVISINKEGQRQRQQVIILSEWGRRLWE